MVSFLDDSHTHQRLHPPTRLHRGNLRTRRWVARHRRAVIAALLLVAALASVRALTPAAPHETSVQLWVSARDLPSGHVLSMADLQAQPWPAHLVPPAAVQVDSEAQHWVGQPLALPLGRGELLTRNRFVGEDLLQGVAPGSVAAPVRVADARLLWGLRAGQRLDLYAITQGHEGARRVASGAILLALPGLGNPAPNDLAEPSLLGSSPAEGASDSAVIMVAVPGTQMAKLAQANAAGPVWPALTSPSPPTPERTPPTGAQSPW